MELKRSDMGIRKGKELVAELLSGEFKKEDLENHGIEFKGGKEELYRYRFNAYINSCGCFIMERRLSEEGRGYCG